MKERLRKRLLGGCTGHAERKDRCRFRYAIIYCKGYQESDIAQTGVTVKVKGVASTMHRKDLPQEYRRVWDAADYVIPPLVSYGDPAFTVVTTRTGSNIRVLHWRYSK